MSMPEMPKWYDDDGQIVSCTEKVKVMSENMAELYQTAQDAFEDALLMGCGERQLRDYLLALIEAFGKSLPQSLNTPRLLRHGLSVPFLRLSAASAFQTAYLTL